MVYYIIRVFLSENVSAFSYDSHIPETFSFLK